MKWLKKVFGRRITPDERVEEPKESEMQTPLTTDGGNEDSEIDAKESNNTVLIQELEAKLSEAMAKFNNPYPSAIPVHLKNLLWVMIKNKLTYMLGFGSNKSNLNEENIRKTESLISLLSSDRTPTERELSLIAHCEKLMIELELKEKELDYRSRNRGPGYSDDEQEYRSAAMAEYSVRTSLDEALDELIAEIDLRLQRLTITSDRNDQQ